MPIIPTAGVIPVEATGMQVTLCRLSKRQTLIGGSVLSIHISSANSAKGKGNRGIRRRYSQRGTWYFVAEYATGIHRITMGFDPYAPDA